jgi:hypothetical protein
MDNGMNIKKHMSRLKTILQKKKSNLSLDFLVVQFLLKKKGRIELHQINQEGSKKKKIQRVRST